MMQSSTTHSADSIQPPSVNEHSNRPAINDDTETAAQNSNTNNDSVNVHVLVSNNNQHQLCIVSISDYCTLSELRDRISVLNLSDQPAEYQFLYNNVIVQQRQESLISVGMTINVRHEIYIKAKLPVSTSHTPNYERYITPATPRRRSPFTHRHHSDINDIHLQDTQQPVDLYDNNSDFYVNTSPQHKPIPIPTTNTPARSAFNHRYPMSMPAHAPIHDVNRSAGDISDSDVEESKYDSVDNVINEESALLRKQAKRLMSTPRISTIHTSSTPNTVKYRSLDDNNSRNMYNKSSSPFVQPVRRIDRQSIDHTDELVSPNSRRGRRLSTNIDRMATTPTIMPSHIPDRVDFDEFLSEDLIHAPSRRFDYLPDTFKITVIGDRDLSDQQQKQGTTQSSTDKTERRAKRHADTLKREKVYTDVNQFLQSRTDERRVVPTQSHMSFFDQSKQKPSHNNTTDKLASIPETDRRTDAPLWICVEDATDDIIVAIGQHFGLHSLTIEDCQSSGIREKLEVFPGYLFLVFHAIDTSDANNTLKHNGIDYSIDVSDTSITVMKTTPLKLIVFGSCVLSFHKSNLASVHAVQKQLKRLYHNKLENTAWLIHALLDNVVDSLLFVVAGACRQVDDVDDLVYADDDMDVIELDQSAAVHKDMLRRMCTIGRRLGFLRQRLWSKRDILMSLIEKDWQTFLTGVKVPYLRDVYDHVVTMLHSLDAAIEINSNLESTYLAIVSIDVNTAAQTTNDVMKRLTAVATIVLPLTLISGIMGMNMFVPFQTGGPFETDADGNPIGSLYPTTDQLVPFWTLFGAMVAIAIALLWYFKKKNLF